MKQRFQGMVAGFLAAILLTGTIAYAATGEEAADIFYNNIKIFIDGAQLTSKDVNGKVIEPFTMNGTTYLPVRAIANAFGKDVVWDEKTASIYLGKKDQNQPDNYLDRIQYSYLNTNTKDENMQSGYFGNKFEKIIGKVTDISCNIYQNGYLMYLRNYTGSASQKLDFALNMQYKRLSGKVVLPSSIETVATEVNDCNGGKTSVGVKIYGDGKVLYSMDQIVPSIPISFDIDIDGVNSISFEVSAESDAFAYVALTDLALYK